jgi:hypothetical protein
MEVVFGVQATERGLRVELEESDVDALRKQLEEVFSEGGAGQILWITDKSGRVLGIPVDKLSYVELGAEKTGRTVGFASQSG